MKKKASRKHEVMKLIGCWKNSGLSVAKFCEQQNVPVNTFRYWLRKIRKEKGNAATSDFIPVQFSNVPFSGQNTNKIEIIYPCGTRVLVREDFFSSIHNLLHQAV